MGKFRCRLATFLALTLFSCHLVSAATLKLAYSDVESYPFQIGNGSEIPEPSGLALDIINHAFSQLNVDIDYVRLPGKRVLRYIKSGRVDGGFIFSYNTKRAQYATYPLIGDKPDSSKRITTLGYYFYKLKDQPLDWDGSSLSKIGDRVIGTHLGFSIARKLKENNINVHEVKNTAQLFSMLRSKRIAAIAIQDTMAQEYLKDKDWSLDVEQVLPAITTKDYYLIFNHQFTQSNPDLVMQAWETISTIRDAVISKESGKYSIH